MSNERYCFAVKQDQGPTTPLETIAARVRDLRKQRAWSAQRLAEQMSTAGVPWERIVVSNLETGRRQSLSITEWLTLARVLDVPPMALLLPLEDTEYQVTPTSAPLSARAVGEWLIAPKPLPPWPNPDKLPVHPGVNFARQQRYFADWPVYLHRPATVPEVEQRAAELEKQIEAQATDLQRLRDKVAEDIHQLQLAQMEPGLRKAMEEAIAAEQTEDQGDDG